MKSNEERFLIGSILNDEEHEPNLTNSTNLTAGDNHFSFKEGYSPVSNASHSLDLNSDHSMATPQKKPRKPLVLPKQDPSQKKRNNSFLGEEQGPPQRQGERKRLTLNLLPSQQPEFEFYQYIQQQPIQQQYFVQQHVNEEMILKSDLDQLCGNQVISRKIQKIFEYGRDDERDIIFNKVERQCLQISKDIFGNYVVQKIFEKGSEQQKYKLFQRLRPTFYELSKNNFGCRVIQKLLDYIEGNEEYQDIFLSEIQPQVKSLIHDMYGNYVLLKCLETMPKEKVEFVIKPVEDTVQFMAQQTYGCRIIQKVLELYPREKVKTVLRVTMSMATSLCFCEYGNYIIQYILKTGPQDEQNKIKQIIRDNFESLSINKYGSNTVEKLFDTIGLEEMQEILKILLKRSSNNELIFLNLCVNPFGNYVVRRFLIICDKDILQPLLKQLKNNADLLNRIKLSEYGNRVYQILEKMIVIV